MISQYSRTDLARECGVNTQQTSGIKYREYTSKGFNVSELDIITKDASEKLGKGIGKYITCDIGKVWNLSERRFHDCSVMLSDKLRKMSTLAVGKDSISNIMIVGLGNRYITSDAIGHETLKNVIVTRHLQKENSKLYSCLGGKSISAVTPGVIGQTGIETLEFVKAAAENVRPELVVVIDALAAIELDHLATTVQITDTGIAPGSGIGNKRLALNKESVGFPLIALGVPTVVESSTLVYCALREAGIDNINENLERVLSSGKSFFVTLKESDTVISEVSRLLSDAINTAFS